MVTQCQNKPYQYLTKKLKISRSIPAHAASSIAIARVVRATVKFARPKKRILIPAVVDPNKTRKASPTAAVTVHGADRIVPRTLFKKE